MWYGTDVDNNYSYHKPRPQHAQYVHSKQVEGRMNSSYDGTESHNPILFWKSKEKVDRRNTVIDMERIEGDKSRFANLSSISKHLIK